VPAPPTDFKAAFLAGAFFAGALFSTGALTCRASPVAAATGRNEESDLAGGVTNDLSSFSAELGQAATRGCQQVLHA
jgi:hypothetical protein